MSLRGRNPTPPRWFGAGSNLLFNGDHWADEHPPSKRRLLRREEPRSVLAMTYAYPNRTASLFSISRFIIPAMFTYPENLLKIVRGDFTLSPLLAVYYVTQQCYAEPSLMQARPFEHVSERLHGHDVSVYAPG